MYQAQEKKMLTFCHSIFESETLALSVAVLKAMGEFIQMHF